MSPIFGHPYGSLAIIIYMFSAKIPIYKINTKFIVENFDI